MAVFEYDTLDLPGTAALDPEKTLKDNKETVIKIAEALLERETLTKEQIEHLSEGEEFSYLSDLASKPDMGNIYSTEITTDGGIDDAYPEPTTTDDKANTMTCDWRGNAKLAGMGAIQMRECTKREWTQKNIYNILL